MISMIATSFTSLQKIIKKKFIKEKLLNNVVEVKRRRAKVMAVALVFNLEMVGLYVHIHQRVEGQ